MSGIRPIFEKRLDERRLFGGERRCRRRRRCSRPRPPRRRSPRRRPASRASRIARTIGLYWRATTSPRSGIGAVAFGQHLGEVLAGAEGAARAREQHGADRGVVRGSAAARPCSSSAMRALKLFRTSGRFERDRQHAVAPLGAGCAGWSSVGKGTRCHRQPHGRTAPLHAARTPDFSVDRPPERSPSRHRPSDDARCATQDPPHALPPRRRSAVRLAPDRVQRARLARARRPRGGDQPQPRRRCRASTWCSTSSRRAGTTGPGRSSARCSTSSTTRPAPTTARRPLLLALGLSIEDALGSPLGRAGGFSDGRDIGVVCNLPNARRAASCCRCPATSARSTRRPPAGRRRSPTTATCSGDRTWDGAIARGAGRRGVGGDERLLVGAHDGDDAQAADAVLHRGQRPRHLGDGRHADAGREHRARTSRRSEPVRARRRRHAIPPRRRRCSPKCVDARARRRRPGAGAAHGAASVQPLGPGQPEGLSHRRRRSRPTLARDPLPKLRDVSRAGVHVGRASGRRSRRRSRATWRRRSTAARARPAPDPATRPPLRLRRGAARRASRWRWAGCRDAERATLGGTRRAGDRGRLRAIRRSGAAHAARASSR